MQLFDRIIIIIIIIFKELHYFFHYSLKNHTTQQKWMANPLLLLMLRWFKKLVALMIAIIMCIPCRCLVFIILVLLGMAIYTYNNAIIIGVLLFCFIMYQQYIVSTSEFCFIDITVCTGNCGLFNEAWDWTGGALCASKVIIIRSDQKTGTLYNNCILACLFAAKFLKEK